MFGRRIPLSLLSRLRHVVWPRSGWRRLFSYLGHRVRRLPGTPESIAAGVASGVAISFTPFIGLHFALACGLAWLLRGNLIAAAVGTVAGNPWTFPFIWAWILALGRWILGDSGQYEPPPDATLLYMIEHPLLLLWPMTLGGIPTAVVAWFVSYYPFKRMVAEYQKARARRLRKKIGNLSGAETLARSAMPSSDSGLQSEALPGGERGITKELDGARRKTAVKPAGTAAAKRAAS